MNRLCNALRTSLSFQHHNSVIKVTAAQNATAFWLRTTTTTPTTGLPGKTKESPKITLLAQNQSITVTSLEEAKKLAKRRDLHLIQVQEFDAKTQRPVYKLATPAEVLSEELAELNTSEKSPTSVEKDKTTPHKKSEKALTIGCRISEHDLASRLKNVAKWLTKRHEVRILVQGNNADDMSSAEKIFKAIEQSIKEPEVIGKIVQKRTKGSVIKFNIIPAAPATSATSSRGAPHA